jgi:hypothetical protein
MLEIPINKFYVFVDGYCIVDDSRGHDYLAQAFYYACLCKGMNRYAANDAALLMADVARGHKSGHWVASAGFACGTNAGDPVGRRRWILLSTYNVNLAIAASAAKIASTHVRCVGGSRRRRNARRRVNR